MDFIDKNFTLQVHEDALRVLEEVGVKCTSLRLRQVFEDTGLAAYDDSTGHLHILPALVEQTLNTVPKRDSYWIPENSFGIGGTAPFVYDDNTGDLIAPTFEHLKCIAQIAEEADVVQFMARGVLIPQQETAVIDTIVEYCNKPIYVAVITPAGIARAKEIHETRAKITVQFSIINSPLNVIESMIEPFIACVESGLPIYVSSMPMAGLSGPYSMSSLLTLTHAEALFGIAFAQLLNPGLMVVHAGLPSIADVNQNYAVNLGTMSHNVANLLMEKINAGLKLASIQTACSSSQSEPNALAQAEAEKGYALMKQHGFHQTRHAFGFLKELVSFSIAKLENHIELCRNTPAQDIAVDFIPYDIEGFDVIRRNGSNANYMRDDHTLKNVGVSFLT
jgi:trimethylamine:corrinoid methyltransferase-like protein